MHSFAVSRALGLRSLFAVSLAVLSGCAEDPRAPRAADLRARFPEQADAILRGEEPLTAGQAWAERAGELRASFPARAEEPVRLKLEGELDVHVRELGAFGEGDAAEDAVVYERIGGASFWAAMADGYEEWLLINPAVFDRNTPVGEWEIGGAALRQNGEAVDLLDTAGAPRIQVTAPEAFAEGGRPISTRLEVDGSRIRLWVDAGEEAVLVDPGWKALRSKLNLPRFDHTATLLDDGRVLIAGGHTAYTELIYTAVASAELFDPATRTFTNVPPMKIARGHAIATRLLDGRVLIAGGRDSFAALGDPLLFRDAEIFDPKTSTWVTVPPMSIPRVWHTAARLLDGRVLITGGAGDASSELFDPNTLTWMLLPPASVARENPTATLLQDGRVLIAGGAAEDPDHLKALDSTELFDPKTLTFTPAPPMGVARRNHTAILLEDGRVLIAGGFDGKAPLGSTEIFDPSQMKWIAAAPMHSARYDHSAARLKGGRVLFAGGSNGATTYMTGAELFDPVTCGQPVGTMLAGRGHHTATLLDDGRVLIAGGSTHHGHLVAFFPIPLESAELFDPSAPGFSPVPSMSGPRWGHTATLLDDGRVLVAGNAPDPPATAELFEPETLAWTAAPPMINGHSEHTATLLDDGRVLIAGGSDSNSKGEISNTVEVFDPKSGTFSEASSMLLPRTDHAATRLPDGRVLVTGEGIINSEVFDPKTQLWVALPPMSESRAGHTATLTPDGLALIAGDASAELFDPKNNAWILVAPMTFHHASHTATLLDNGAIFIAAGAAADSPNSSDAEVFDPTTRAWSAAPPLSLGRAFHTATLLDDGRVLVAGGGSSSTELFEPEAQTWTAGPPLHVSRQSHTATKLRDGRVLIAGGDADGTAELWSLQSLGTACIAARDCESGFCADGVCCDSACNAGLCDACSEHAGAAADGVCVDLHPECSPFGCAPATGTCSKPCKSAHDCAPGYVCRPPGDCVPPPPGDTFVDKGSCAVRHTVGAGAASRARDAALLLLLGALLARGRRTASAANRPKRPSW